MAPGAFYLAFTVLRLRDLFRGARSQIRPVVSRLTTLLLTVALPCAAALVAGCVVLLGTFGWRVLAVSIAMVALNLTFMHIMKAPTAEGRKLLEEIAGFRDFLKSVEKLPMNRADAPSKDVGVYEKYLPYAVALEVEQQWSDSAVALASTNHGAAFAPCTHAFYLGMWNDKPVEVGYRALPYRYR